MELPPQDLKAQLRIIKIELQAYLRKKYHLNFLMIDPSVSLDILSKECNFLVQEIHRLDKLGIINSVGKTGGQKDFDFDSFIKCILMREFIDKGGTSPSSIYLDLKEAGFD